jgi:hypothetical protein
MIDFKPSILDQFDQEMNGSSGRSNMVSSRVDLSSIKITEEHDHSQSTNGSKNEPKE